MQEKRDECPYQASSACVGPYLPSGGETKDTGKGYRYTWEVNIWGVGLWAQSGYSERVKIRWKFGTAHDKYLLFSDDAVTKAGILYAYNPPA